MAKGSRPDGSSALAVQQLGRLVLYTGLRGATPPAALNVPGAIAAADHFAWAANSTGNAAAVYSSRTGQAQILTSLAQSPVAAVPIDLSGLPGQVTALAFDGQRLIVGVASNEAGGIYLASASSGIQRIAHAASPSAIDLAGASLYFADNQAQQIWQVQSYAGTPAAVLFANDSGISSPAGLQVSADGLRLYAVNAGSRTLAVYDIASRSPVQSLDISAEWRRARTPICGARRRSGEGRCLLRSGGARQSQSSQGPHPAQLVADVAHAQAPRR